MKSKMPEFALTQARGSCTFSHYEESAHLYDQQVPSSATGEQGFS